MSLPKFFFILMALLLLGFPSFAQRERPGDGGGSRPGTGLPTLSTDDLPLIDLWGQARISSENLDFGESINLDNGQLSFLVTDVSIPGNSNLPVAFGRRIGRNSYLARGRIGSLGMDYNNSASGVFYDNWIADVPIITGVAKGGAQFNQEEDIPYQGGPRFLGWVGVHMSIPGEPVKSLKYAKAPNPAFAQGHRYATDDHWVIKRFEGANPSFEARAPNGTTYRFNHVINDAYQYRKGGGIIAATEITDVHGNWVRYEYSGTKLTRIHANDGRSIAISYSPGIQHQQDVITSVTANGRTWTYDYDTGGELYRVYLPDGRYWQFDRVWQLSTAITACSWLNANARTLGVRHPSGAYAEYTIQPIHNGRIILEADINLSSATYSAAFKGTSCEQKKVYHTLSQSTTEAGWLSLGYVSHAVRQKTLTVPRSGTHTWSYAYDQDYGAFREALGLALTKARTITKPDGTKETVHIYRVADWREGLTEKIETKTASDTVLETVTRTYQRGPSVLYHPIPIHPSWPEYDVHQRYAKLLVSETTTRGSDTYTTANVYNADASQSTYDFGQPHQVTQSSSVQTGQRIFQYDWQHDPVKWILGLTTSVTQNSKLIDSFTYNSSGQVTAHSKYGVTQSTLGYHSSGTQAGLPSWHRDTLNRQTGFSNYKRGQAQSITRRDNTTLSQVIDDNGWVISQTNGRGIITGYEYNNLGWLTRIDRPGTWADTTIVYSSLGNGLIATATRGQFQEQRTYDGLHREILTRKTDLSGSQNIYTKTGHDGLGRVTFSSFPSGSAAPAAGTNFTYDGLSRPTQARETVTPFATTSTAYLAGNQIRVTDPSGAQTTSTYRAFGAPATDEVMRVVDATGTTTTMTRDIYGNITNLNQTSGLNGHTVNVSRQFWYDDRMRLCRHRAPEFGDELFAYDNANQLTLSSRGETAGSTCAIPSAALSTAFAYDALGRQTHVNYPGTTPDITRTFDNNGNQLTANRGGVNWSYSYDTLDAISQEQLSMDGRVFTFDYTRNSNGHVTHRSSPSGLTFAFDPDAFGRPRKLAAGSTNHLSGITWHPNGQVASGTYANGQAFSQTLTLRQQPLRATHSKAGGHKAVDLIYSYDARGKISSITDYVQPAYNQSFTYDASGRLLTANGHWGVGQFRYDGLGNLRQKRLGSRYVDISYNSDNQISSVTDTANPARTFVHDTRGNVTNDGRFTFVYDAANQPTSVNIGTATLPSVYDGNLKRAKNVIRDSNATNVTVYTAYSQVSGRPIYRYFAGSGIQFDYVEPIGPMAVWFLDGNVHSYRHLDHLGSWLTKSESDGNSSSKREQYTPFGERLIEFTNHNNPGFTGHVRDMDTGLNYMQARYYDPTIGRFLSTDPIGYQDQLNLYAYVHNDPINAWDPTGEEAWLVARPINFADSDHMFVVVADELGGEIQHQFSFGPEHGFNLFTGKKGAFGSLVALQGTETPTNTDDVAAWRSLADGDANGVSATPINASDQAVIDAGQAVTQALGTPDNPGNIVYYPVTNPGTVSNGCNSNCGAYGTAVRALENDGNTNTQSLPSGARAPGWGQNDHVLDEVDRQ